MARGEQATLVMDPKGEIAPCMSDLSSYDGHIDNTPHPTSAFM